MFIASLFTIVDYFQGNYNPSDLKYEYSKAYIIARDKITELGYYNQNETNNDSFNIEQIDIHKNYLLNTEYKNIEIEMAMKYISYINRKEILPVVQDPHMININHFNVWIFVLVTASILIVNILFVCFNYGTLHPCRTKMLIHSLCCVSIFFLWYLFRIYEFFEFKVHL
jgi:hypothetical protein